MVVVKRLETEGRLDPEVSDGGAELRPAACRPATAYLGDGRSIRYHPRYGALVRGVVIRSIGLELGGAGVHLLVLHAIEAGLERRERLDVDPPDAQELRVAVSISFRLLECLDELRGHPKT